MPDRTSPRDYFDALWAQGDPWDLDTSEYDQGKYARELAILSARRFGKALEIGCGAGAFTRRLAPATGSVLALDVSAEAIRRAREAGADARVEYRVADAVAFDPVAEGPWDLIVLSETIYYLGWRHSFFDVGWMARQLVESLAGGGCLLMTNTLGPVRHPLQLKSLIETYRDLFLNTGLRLASSETYSADKAGVPLEALICLFEKPAVPVTPSSSTARSGS